jgi:hypothetical protein
MIVENDPQREVQIGLREGVEILQATFWSAVALSPSAYSNEQSDGVCVQRRHENAKVRPRNGQNRKRSHEAKSPLFWNAN